MAKKVKFKSLKKAIRSIIEDSVREIVDEILDERLQFLEAKIDEKFDNLDRNFKSEEEFNRIKEENSVLNERLSNLEKENREYKERLNNLEKNINNLKDELNQSRKTIEDLNRKIREKEKELEEKNRDLEKLNQELEQLKIYSGELEKENRKNEEKINNLNEELVNCNSNLYKEKEEKEILKSEIDKLKSQKEFKLLKALLNNPALKDYREKYNIKGEDLISLFNLNRFLSSPRVFINSYYDYLVEYKKANPYEMDDREIEFYKAVNEYFNEEVIKDIKKFEEGSFDKTKHRGINNETRGEISDDKIVLIPTHLDSKMRVKLK